MNWETKRKLVEAYNKITYRRKPFLKILDFSPEPPLLDVGCGGGQNCKILREVLCLDISVKQLTDAREHGCNFLVNADMEFLPFRDESFSTLLYMASLHHLDDTKTAIHEAKRVLKEGGKIMATVWRSNVRMSFVKSTSSGERYFRLYYPGELKEEMEISGFETIHDEEFERISNLNEFYVGRKRRESKSI